MTTHGESTSKSIAQQLREAGFRETSISEAVATYVRSLMSDYGMPTILEALQANARKVEDIVPRIHDATK